MNVIVTIDGTIAGTRSVWSEEMDIKCCIIPDITLFKRKY